ncbi:MAG: hypothetical protein ABW098_08290 [Candidatus Thiodiazotropha sp.]
MKNSLQTVCCVLAILISATCQAEFSPQNLPSMRTLFTQIGNMDRADRIELDRNTFDAQGRITSNMPAPESARGETANQLATLLCGGSDALRQTLASAFLNNRDRFVKNLLDNNYAANDMGVAYAVGFVLLWELASERGLSKTASDNAAKFLIRAFRSLNTEYVNITPDDKAKIYDWLITTPVAMASLVLAYIEAGRLQEVKMLRDKSALIFEDVFKLSHDELLILENGEIVLKTEKVLAYQ